MANRDYVLRLIEQAAAALRQALNRLRKKGDRGAVTRDLEQAARQGGFDLALLRLFDGPTLVQAVAPGGEPETGRMWLAAETLYLDARAAEDEGQQDEAKRTYAKALLLYRLLEPSVILPTGFPEALERIADIETRLQT